MKLTDDEARARPLPLRVAALLGAFALLSIAVWFRALTVADGDRPLAVVTTVLCMAIFLILTAVAVVVAARRRGPAEDRSTTGETGRSGMP